MYPIMPKITMPVDREDHIMTQTGWIVGFHTYAKKPYEIVWCFGFLPGSPQSEAYGISVDKQLWFICDKKGNVKETASGLKKDLPIRFHRILDGADKNEKGK